MKSGTLKFQDGSEAQWELVETVPYDPSCYSYDEGIIVAVQGRVESVSDVYFISLGDGNVYCSDNGRAWDDGGSLTQYVEGAYCPEIKAGIEKRDAQLEAVYAGDPGDECQCGKC